MWRIRLAAADRREWQIDNGIERRRASFQRIGVDVNLERTSDLSDGLRGTIEFGILKTVAADHGFDFPGGIIDGEKRPLRAGLLFELGAHGVVAQFLNRELRQVADFQQIAGFLAASPDEIVGREDSAVRADLDDRVFVRHREDKPGDVTSLLDGMPPIVVFVRIQFAEIVAQHVGKVALPAVAPFVTVQTIAQSLVRDALHVDIQRGVNTQAALVDSRRSIRRFEILANLFEEIRCKVVARILNVQPERRFSGVAFFCRRNLPFFFHAMDHQIAAA